MKAPTLYRASSFEREALDSVFLEVSSYQELLPHWRYVYGYCRFDYVRHRAYTRLSDAPGNIWMQIPCPALVPVPVSVRILSGPSDRNSECNDY